MANLTARRLNEAGWAGRGEGSQGGGRFPQSGDGQSLGKLPGRGGALGNRRALGASDCGPHHQFGMRPALFPVDMLSRRWPLDCWTWLGHITGVNYYQHMLTDLRQREAVLVAELERCRKLQAAITPLIPQNDEASVYALGRATWESLAHVTSVSSSGAPPEPSNLSVFKIATTSPPTLADLAYAVLKEAGRPLPLKKVVQGVQARGGGRGKPLDKVRSSLVPALRRNPERFEVSRRGVYALREWKIEEKKE